MMQALLTRAGLLLLLHSSGPSLNTP